MTSSGRSPMLQPQGVDHLQQHGHHQRTPTGGPRPSPSAGFVSCNKCRKPLTTTLFVLSCECVVCEGCAYTHFQASTSCPCCRKPVSENNLFELVIAGPSQALQQSTKHCYQSIFTKQVSNKQPLSHEEMCTRLLKNFDDNRRAMRFVLKQFVVESTKQSELHRALHHTKEEYAQYKQAVAAEKAQSDQVNADLHNKVQVMAAELNEYKNQVASLRQLVVQDAALPPTPSSSHSHGSGGGKRGPSQRYNQGRSHVEGFLMNKQVQQHPQSMSFMQPQNRGNSHGQGEPIMTPIQTQPQSSSFRPRTSNGSTTSYTSNAGYVFSSSSHGVPTIKHNRDENTAPPQVHHFSRHQNMAPTTAFAYNTTGATSTASRSSSFHKGNSGSFGSLGGPFYHR